MFCKYCGAQLRDGSKFCQFCGAKLEGPEYAKPAEPVQAAEAVQAEAAAAADAVEKAVQPEPVVQEIPPVPPVAQEIPPVQPAQQQDIYRQPEAQQYVPPVESQYVPPVDPQVQQAADYDQTQPVQQKKKSKKGLIIGLIVGGAVLIALIVLFLLVFLPMILDARKIEIDFRKYADIKCEGYDTIGNAEATYDWNALLAEYGEDLKFTRKYKYMSDSYEPGELIQEMVYYYVDHSGYDDLSNGDTVDYVLNVYPEISEMLNVAITDSDKYTNGEITIPMTVTGLEEAELFDPFENIEITVTGMSPFGSLSYSFANSPIPSQENEYAFSVDKQYDLANGDVVTFTLDDWYAEDFFLSEYGMLPTATTYEYTVEGLEELVTDVAQISAEDMDNLKSLAAQHYYDYHISDDDAAIQTSYYGVIGTILKVSNSPSEYGWDNNTLYCVVEQDFTIVDPNGTYPNYDGTVYGVIYFENLTIKDGKLVFDETNWDSVYHSYTLEVGVWDVSGNYAFTSVDEVRSTLIDNSDTYYTYIDAINK